MTSQRERRVAALVRADQRAVHPHRRRVVDGAEVQQQAGSRSAGAGASNSGDTSSAGKAGVTDAAARRLGRERHLDRRGPRHVRGSPSVPLSSIANSQGPFSEHPTGTMKLRPRAWHIDRSTRHALARSKRRASHGLSNSSGKCRSGARNQLSRSSAQIRSSPVSLVCAPVARAASTPWGHCERSRYSGCNVGRMNTQYLPFILDRAECRAASRTGS